MSQLPPDPLDLWILAGQSNMVGRAPLLGALSPPPDPRVWCFGSNGKWDIAREPLHRLWESFTAAHLDLLRQGIPEDQRHLPDEHWAAQERQSARGAGLGIAFAQSLLGAQGSSARLSVGLIPCAHGGVSLEQWNRAHKHRGAASLYGAMIQRIERCRQRGRLKGILWYQGETDAMARRDGDTYAERFDAWIDAVRSDTRIADLPVIAVQLGRLHPSATCAFEGVDAVRRALLELPQRVANTAVTSAIDLGLIDDCHIGTAGLIRLGRRMARQALRLTSQPTLPSGPSVRSTSFAPGEKAGYHAIRIELEGVCGRLIPSENIGGFRVDEATAAPPRILSVDQCREDAPASTDHKAHRAAVRVLLDRAPSPALRVGYGCGPAPQCNLADEADMPLCAFPLRAVASDDAAIRWAEAAAR